MSEYPSDWEETTLGSVFNQRKEAGFPNEELLAVTSSMGVVRRDSLERRDTSNEDKSKYLLVQKGDIAYNTMRMWQGVSGVSRFRGIVSPAYTICTPTEGLDAMFAGYLLKDPEMVSVFRQRSQGLVSDTWNLKYESFAQIPCTIPPLPEQNNIAEILSGIDRQVGLISRAIDSNRAARNALMESIFHEGHRKATNRSDEWRIWTVEELLANSATPMRSGPFGSALLKEELADEGIPFLGIDNVKTEEFIPTFKRFLPPQKFQQLSRYEVFPHDVMITIMGTVGRSCVVPAGIGPCVSSKHTWTMTFDRHKVAPEIVCWQLNHFTRTRKRFSEGSQGGVMDAISSQTLRETEVPFPTAQDLADRILGYYKISLRHEKEMRARLEKTRLLKSAVSSDLLSGRKRVSV